MTGFRMQHNPEAAQSDVRLEEGQLIVENARFWTWLPALADQLPPRKFGMFHLIQVHAFFQISNRAIISRENSSETDS